MRQAQHHRTRFISTAFGILGVVSCCFSAAAAHTQCPGPIPAPPDNGICRIIEGSGTSVLLQSDFVLPDGTLGNGQLLFNGAGLISCMACDCSAHPDAEGARRLECPEAVVSPGLVDALQRLSFVQSEPWVPPDTAERYDHRHGWRLGIDGGTSIGVISGASANQVRWAELRSVMAGVTSIASSGGDGQAGFARNLNRFADAEDLGIVPVRVESFPLGDSNGVTRTEDCSYNALPAVDPTRKLILNLAEGVDDRARNEFACTSGQAVGSVDALEGAALEGGVALNTQDLVLLRDAGASLIWQPRHQVSVYGMTAPITTALALQLPVGLSSYWRLTGSLHLGRELACARALDQNAFGGTIGDARLWAMATVGSATTLDVQHALGVLAPGLVADLLVTPRRGLEAHTAVITAEAKDISLVLRGGVALYGDAELIEAFDDDAEDCDQVVVCTSAKRVCVSRETAGLHTLASLQLASGTTAGPLFSCGAPLAEPSCVPARTAPFAYPAALGDTDGDGVLNEIDNCPLVFNPPRPVDGGVQLDSNGNGVGDACEVCPLTSNDPACPPMIFTDRFQAGSS